MTGTPAISIRHLSVTFNHAPALEDITLDIREGSYVGILGPNGGQEHVAQGDPGPHTSESGRYSGVRGKSGQA